MNSASVPAATRRIGRHDRRQADQRGDRREVLDRVVAEVRIERRVDRHRAGIAEHQHMAVGRRLGDHVGGDDAAGARHVLDDEGLAERVGEFFREQPRQHVGIAAGAGGRDQPHRMGGPGLVLRQRGGMARRAHQGREQGERQAIASGVPPVSSLSARLTPRPRCRAPARPPAAAFAPAPPA